MLVWVAALIDMELHPAEKKQLSEYGNMLGLNPTQQNDCIRKAKYYVLEISMNIDADKTTLFDIAKDLELSDSEAERCLIQWKKRNG